MRQLIAAMSGALIVGGGLTIVAGARRTTAMPRPRRRRPRRTDAAVRFSWARWRWPAAIAAGVVAWLITGLPVALPIAAAATVVLPVLLGTTRAAAAGIARVEAIEAWTRRLADILLAGAGLEQAITTSLRTCPAPIRTEVGALGARLAARWPTDHALRAFADDMNDATADLVVAALILASRRRGPGLARALTSVADSVAEEVAVRRKIEAERAKPRTTARSITLIAVTVLGVGAFGGTCLTPYADPIGQLVLATLAAAFIGCLLWMRNLTLTPAEPRFLQQAAEPSAEVSRR